MFIQGMSQSWMLIVISILFLIDTTIMFSILGYTILKLWICKKSFSFHDFTYNYCSSVKWDKLGYSLWSVFFSLLALQLCSPYWDTRYWSFRFARKAFFSTIFLIINVHPWMESNLDTHSSLHFFCYGHHNHVLFIGIHDIDALDLQEKLLLPLFSI